jgi:hypothetical protein
MILLGGSVGHSHVQRGLNQAFTGFATHPWDAKERNFPEVALFTLLDHFVRASALL